MVVPGIYAKSSITCFILLARINLLDKPHGNISSAARFDGSVRGLQSMTVVSDCYLWQYLRMLMYVSSSICTPPLSHVSQGRSVNVKLEMVF